MWPFRKFGTHQNMPDQIVPWLYWIYIILSLLNPNYSFIHIISKLRSMISWLWESSVRLNTTFVGLSHYYKYLNNICKYI
jgi:hypothetical protein